MTLEVSGNLMAAALTFDANKLVINYDATKGTFSARGGVNFTTRGTKINLKLGSTNADGVQTDGLLIEDGTLKTLDAAITGGFEFSKVKFSAKSLRFTYKTDAGTSRFEVKGNASLEFGNGSGTSKADVTFGQNGLPGLVFTNGSFDTMNLLVTGNVTIGGVTFTTKELVMTYTAATGIFTARGGASFVAKVGCGAAAKTATIDLKLGSTSAEGVATEGIVVENGTLKTLDAAITSSFEFSKVQFTTKSLRFCYSNDAGKTHFTVSGAASLKFTAGGKDSTADVSFGTKELPGLVFNNGSFDSMSQKIDGNLQVSGLTLVAKSLMLTYDANKICLLLAARRVSRPGA